MLEFYTNVNEIEEKKKILLTFKVNIKLHKKSNVTIDLSKNGTKASGKLMEIKRLPVAGT